MNEFNMIKNKYEFIASLLCHDNKKIICYSEEDLKIIDGYSQAQVFFCDDNNQSYQIDGESTVNIFLLTLQKLLKKSLFGNLVLDDSVHNNIGYVWNQWINDSTVILPDYTDNNNDTYWVGLRYELSSYDAVAWVYNDKDYNIIFEVTPAYPLGCIDQDNKSEVEKYQAWMKSYKSIYKTIIPVELVQTWLLQIQEILEIIDKNTELMMQKNNSQFL